MTLCQKQQHIIPEQEAKICYNFNNDKQEWFIEEILAHRWTNNDLELQVKWTWEMSHGNQSVPVKN